MFRALGDILSKRGGLNLLDAMEGPQSSLSLCKWGLRLGPFKV